jgi:hypothetical protein
MENGNQTYTLHKLLAKVHAIKLGYNYDNDYYLKHVANCDIPIVKNTVKLAYNSTLEGSQLLIWCLRSPNDTAKVTGSAVCRGDGSWSVDLAAYDCSNFGKLIKIINYYNYCKLLESV